MIIKPASPKQTGQIPIAKAPIEQCIRFSFKYLDTTSNKKFDLQHCKGGYLSKFLARLKDLEGWRLKDFRGGDPTLRGHPIRFLETTEPQGFTCLNLQLRQHEAWQFSLTANKHGRVHGLLMDDVFYIVWLDPAHKLYQ